jgi:acyl-CoA reductase-like NAD-dependent aldehyde dehydrogenase
MRPLSQAGTQSSCMWMLIQAVFELGGKAAAVVLDDADLDVAADKIVFAGLMHAGQICMSTERVICSDKIGDELVAKLAERIKKLSAGDEKDGHQLPCLFRESSAAGVLDMLENAVKAGGKLVVGDLKRQGAVIQPHLIDKLPTTCKLWEEESFGPVITVMRVNEGVQAMIDLVNSSEYTLTNSVYGTNIEDCMNVAKGMRGGSAHINGPTLSVLIRSFAQANCRSRQIVRQEDSVDLVGMVDLVDLRA